jgi:hypothetical protein
METIQRRKFFLKSGLLVTGTLLFPGRSNSETPTTNFMQDRPAPISAELVQEFVKVSHGNFAKVKEMLDQQPNLLNAAWDWGNGDYETGMNAAGHVGHVEIAEFLLSKGARMDIFCATMLGRIEIVKPILDAYPNLKTSKGPHGLKLLHHAEKGGENAKKVLEYLKGIGAE